MKSFKWLLVFFVFQALQCLGDEREKVEEAALEFPLQQTQMERYLAVVEAQHDVNDDDETLVLDFHYVYALQRGATAKQDLVRVEYVSSAESVDGQLQNRSFRQLRRGESFWQDRIGDGRFSDYTEQLKEEPELDDNAWDPFTMPINYYATFRVDNEHHGRDITKYVMPVGQLLSAEIDPLEKRIGRWRRGYPKELGYTEIVFDPDVGNMPIMMRMRRLKGGVETVDLDDPIGCTKLYQQNRTKWIQHHSGRYVPEVVECIRTLSGTSGWRLKIAWWLDDEVPDEVFELDDLLMAHVNGSVVNKLVDDRKRKIEAAGKVESTNSK